MDDTWIDWSRTIRWSVQRIGVGSYGWVYKISGAGTFALKCFKDYSVTDGLERGLFNEIMLYRTLRGNPRIVQMIAHGPAELFEHFNIPDGFVWVMVLRYCKVLDSTLCGLSDPTEVRIAWTDLACSLAAIHDFGFAHRDITRGNVLIDEGVMKLSDFSLASTPSEEYRGTPSDKVQNRWYRAPEVSAHTYENTTQSLDIFGLGILFLSLMSPEMNYWAPSDDHDVVLFSVYQHGITNTGPMWDIVSPSFKQAPMIALPPSFDWFRRCVCIRTPNFARIPMDQQFLVFEMLNPDPTARPSIHGVLRRLGVLSAPRYVRSVSKIPMLEVKDPETYTFPGTSYAWTEYLAHRHEVFKHSKYARLRPVAPFSVLVQTILTYLRFVINYPKAVAETPEERTLQLRAVQYIMFELAYLNGNVPIGPVSDMFEAISTLPLERSFVDIKTVSHHRVFEHIKLVRCLRYVTVMTQEDIAKMYDTDTVDYFDTDYVFVETAVRVYVLDHFFDHQHAPATRAYRFLIDILGSNAIPPRFHDTVTDITPRVVRETDRRMLPFVAQVSDFLRTGSYIQAFENYQDYPTFRNAIIEDLGQSFPRMSRRMLKTIFKRYSDNIKALYSVSRVLKTSLAPTVEIEFDFISLPEDFGPIHDYVLVSKRDSVLVFESIKCHT